MKVYKSYFFDIDHTSKFKEIDYIEKILLNLDYDTDINKYKKFLAENCDVIVEELGIPGSKVLVKGAVQSGKTINLIYIVATLIKKHQFKLFIIQSGRCNALNEQIFNRFKNNFKNTGIRIKCYKCKTFDLERVKRDYQEGIEAVVIINLKHLKEIDRKVEDFINEENWKFLVIDDEADDASLINHYEQKMNKLLQKNGSYLQITATPYKSLKKYDNKGFYTLYKSLKSPKYYKGLEGFVKTFPNISEEELSQKLFYKIILLSFQNKKNSSLEYGKIIFNLHIKKNIHESTAALIKNFLNQENIINYIKLNIPEIYNKMKFNEKDIDDLIKFIDSLRGSVYILNDSKEYTITETNQIIIGGKIISRGLTFNNLLAQLIIIDNKKFEAGNIMQKARWFGYHKCDVKIFMNEKLFNAYKECLELEIMTDSFQINNKSQNYSQEFDNRNFKLIKINIPTEEV